MNVLETEFGKKITTRSWSTVLRLARAAEQEVGTTDEHG
jgi:hypothetical protein